MGRKRTRVKNDLTGARVILASQSGLPRFDMAGTPLTRPKRGQRTSKASLHSSNAINPSCRARPATRSCPEGRLRHARTLARVRAFCRLLCALAGGRRGSPRPPRHLSGRRGLALASACVCADVGGLRFVQDCPQRPRWARLLNHGLNRRLSRGVELKSDR